MTIAQNIIRSFLIVFLAYDYLFAQNPSVKFERILVVQGQRLGGIHSLEQDSQGFMWFGTNDGLYRYDATA